MWTWGTHVKRRLDATKWEKTAALPNPGKGKTWARVPVMSLTEALGLDASGQAKPDAVEEARLEAEARDLMAAMQAGTFDPATWVEADEGVEGGG